MEIWNALGHAPLVFVRFTPNKYKDGHGNNVPSPWGGKCANGVAALSKKWKAAWDARLDKLRLTVEHYIESSNINDQFELVHLYY